MEMREKYIARLINEPKPSGFTEVKMVNAPQIATARWMRQRCWYLCEASHEVDTVPPLSPSADETQAVLEEFRFGLMISKEVGFPFPQNFDPVWLDFQRSLTNAENQAFVRGYGKAFLIGSGNCLFGHHDDSLRPCRFAGKKRPTMEAVGINLHETLNMIGWDDLRVRDPHEPFQMFGLLLLE